MLLRRSVNVVLRRQSIHLTEPLGHTEVETAFARSVHLRLLG